MVLALLTLYGVVSVNDAAAQKKGASGAQARANSRRRQPSPAAGDDRASVYLEEGQRHADAGNWAAALQAYKQATAINPRHPEAHIYVGDAFMNLGKYEEAFAAYKEAVRVAPSNAEAHYSLGAAYNYLDIHSAAIRPLVQATLLDPNYAEAHYGAGYAYLKQGDFKQALGYLKRAVKLRNDYPEAHLSLGLAYLGLGQTKSAEEQLKVLEGMNAALARELDKELRRTATTPPDTNLPSSADTTAEVLTTKPQPLKPKPDSVSPPISSSPRASTQKAENDSAMSPQPRPAQVAPAQPPVAEPKQTDAEPKQEEAADTQTKTEDAAAAAPTAEPAPTPVAGARREPTIEETLRLLKEVFSNNLTYTTTVPGEDANVVKVTSEVVIEYEPLRFDNCRIEWRDHKDILSVAISDLDPLGIQIEPRSRPNTTFSIPIWNLTLNTVGGALAIREIKGDRSGTINNYHSLDLQFGNKEKAEKLVRLLQQAIKLCENVP